MISTVVALVVLSTPGEWPRSAVLRAQERVIQMDLRRRGRVIPAARVFKSLGPEALVPMLEQLRADDAGGPLRPSARRAVRVGMIEAIGALRDPRAQPVLIGLLSGAEEDPAVARAAANALGMLATDEAAGVLIAASKPGAPHRDEVLAGMGSCRRVSAARALAEALDSRPAPRLAAAIMTSLGEIGSSWAWQTGLPHAEEEPAVRATARAALERALRGYEGAAQQSARDALRLLD
jgi:hypothetical protein